MAIGGGVPGTGRQSDRHVAIPDDVNVVATYAGAQVKDAPHPEAARAWLEFIRSPEALKIFERYGFKPYTD